MGPDKIMSKDSPQHKRVEAVGRKLASVIELSGERSSAQWEFVVIRGPVYAWDRALILPHRLSSCMWHIPTETD